MAKDLNYRARSVFKLKEIDDQYKMLKNGSVTIDIGSHPGSWSQYAAIKTKSKLLAIDILPMKNIPGVIFMQNNILHTSIAEIRDRLREERVDLVLSDMSPNLSGIKYKDEENILKLNKKVLNLSSTLLKKNGNLLMKTFSNSNYNFVFSKAQQLFVSVRCFKPASSTSRSRETFLVCQNLKLL